MSDTFCKETGEPILSYENAQIIVYPSNETHTVDIDWLFEEIAKGKGKGLEKMQKFVQDRHCLFG